MKNSFIRLSRFISLIVLLWCQVVPAQAGQNQARGVDPALRAELLAMMEEDQKVRSALLKSIAKTQEPAKANRTDSSHSEAEESKKAREARRHAKEVGERHLGRMRELVKRHGWPVKRLVGRDGAHAAWLLVQHADSDPTFQVNCLALMKVAEAGEVERADIAYLTDRIRVGANQPQVYGTQVRDDLTPHKIEDFKNVDRRRASVGLEPLADYLQSVRAAYGKDE